MNIQQLFCSGSKNYILVYKAIPFFQWYSFDLKNDVDSYALAIRLVKTDLETNYWTYPTTSDPLREIESIEAGFTPESLVNINAMEVYRDRQRSSPFKLIRPLNYIIANAIRKQFWDL